MEEKQEYIASNSVIIPSANIDEAYEECLAWCRKKGMKITESDKPSLITAHGIFSTFESRRRYYSDAWEIAIQLSADRKGVQIDFILLNVLNPSLNPRKNQPKHMISPYPRVARSLYKYLGVHTSDDILRDLYPRAYLDRYIRRFSMYLGVCGLATLVLIICGSYREYVSLVRGEVLLFFIFSMAPIFYGLMVFDELFVLRSLRRRLYFNF